MNRAPDTRARNSFLGRAAARFIGTEVAGGAVLVVAAVIGFGWSNSPWGDAYERLWHTEVAVGLQGASLRLDLRHWVNEALMAIFFLVVGAEIRREVVDGDLGDRKRAALPVLAAAGGMVVPALLYLAAAGGTEASRGWGIPMATDIAFALGVLALVGRRLPPALRVFLLALAIVDDIGAIVVIALVYSGGVEPLWLVGAAGLIGLARLLRAAPLALAPLYAVLGVAAWLATNQSGLHATLAGVGMGLVVPERVERALHPWTSFVIVPLFALANAGVDVSGGAASSLTSPAALGVLAGLLVGKPVGVLAFAWLGHRAGIASLPAGVRPAQLAGVALLTGIGFTVSLFVTDLAFGDTGPAAGAKLAVLVSSVVASILGGAALLAAGRLASPSVQETLTIGTTEGTMGIHVVRPDGDGPFPVIVFFHHGPGLDDGSKEAMQLLAGAGYYVVSHDRYHREGPWYTLTPEMRNDQEAMRRFFGVLMGTTEDMVDADLGAVLDHLAADPAAADGPMGCIGYCIGARSVVCTMARHGDRFTAGVGFHPSLCTTDEPDSPHLLVPSIAGSMYIAFGSADRMQPADANQPFIDAVNAMPDGRGQAEVLDGADHGFAVPSSPAYHEAAATHAYDRALRLFAARVRAAD